MMLIVDTFRGHSLWSGNNFEEKDTEAVLSSIVYSKAVRWRCCCLFRLLVSLCALEQRVVVKLPLVSSLVVFSLVRNFE
jgi:hypothetical protein